jgi:hypothetical protein
VLIDLWHPTSQQVRAETFGILTHLAREMPIYVMFALRDDWSNDLIRDCQTRLDPVASWSVDGEPVLLIYRWTPRPA